MLQDVQTFRGKLQNREIVITAKKTEENLDKHIASNGTRPLGVTLYQKHPIRILFVEYGEHFDSSIILQYRYFVLCLCGKVGATPDAWDQVMLRFNTFAGNNLYAASSHLIFWQVFLPNMRSWLWEQPSLRLVRLGRGGEKVGKPMDGYWPGTGY